MRDPYQTKDLLYGSPIEWNSEYRDVPMRQEYFKPALFLALVSVLIRE